MNPFSDRVDRMNLVSDHVDRQNPYSDRGDQRNLDSDRVDQSGPDSDVMDRKTMVCGFEPCEPKDFGKNRLDQLTQFKFEFNPVL